ncbi:hypothetical protein LF1_54500 [Rubripirellula obstinata]|uniref:Uncharacterized protein n=1 Tax=Rubripirellula obstinata TaxID=406547 RepID=A0A5B1CAU3_9BACT|nr:hypothetical protein LF1_54500 [Rubripirellula obstinata]
MHRSTACTLFPDGQLHSPYPVIPDVIPLWIASRLVVQYLFPRRNAVSTFCSVANVFRFIYSGYTRSPNAQRRMDDWARKKGRG